MLTSADNPETDFNPHGFKEKGKLELTIARRGGVLFI